MGATPNIGSMRLFSKYTKCLLAVVALLLLSNSQLSAQTALQQSAGERGFSAMNWWLPDDALLGFVKVPSGSFPMGSNPLIDPMAFENERWSSARRQGIVDVPLFYVSRFESTVAQFRAFVESTSYNADPQSLEGGVSDPVSYVTWTDAVAYARWLDQQLRTNENTPDELKQFMNEGGRVSLASEAQWEKAAKGSEGLIYPWGNQLVDNKANYSSSGKRPVGSLDCSECYLGLADMSGNVWEWTKSPYDDYPFDPSDDRMNLADDALWVMRGGSYSDDANNIRASVRGAADPGARRPFIGFRVVISKD